MTLSDSKPRPVPHSKPREELHAPLLPPVKFVQEINLGAHKRATFALSQLAQSLSWGVVGGTAGRHRLVARTEDHTPRRLVGRSTYIC